MTCRSTTIGTSRPASSRRPGARGQHQRVGLVARRPRCGPGPAARPARTRTGSSNRSSAPAAAASRELRGHRRLRAGRTRPAPRTGPARRRPARKVGNRRATPAGASTSCGSPHCCAERSEPPKVGPSGRPTYSPPVRTNRSVPLSAHQPLPPVPGRAAAAARTPGPRGRTAGRSGTRRGWSRARAPGRTGPGRGRAGRAGPAPAPRRCPSRRCRRRSTSQLTAFDGSGRPSAQLGLRLGGRRRRQADVAAPGLERGRGDRHPGQPEQLAGDHVGEVVHAEPDPGEADRQRDHDRQRQRHRPPGPPQQRHDQQQQHRTADRRGERVPGRERPARGGGDRVDQVRAGPGDDELEHHAEQRGTPDRDQGPRGQPVPPLPAAARPRPAWSPPGTRSGRRRC